MYFFGIRAAVVGLVCLGVCGCSDFLFLLPLFGVGRSGDPVTLIGAPHPVLCPQQYRDALYKEHRIKTLLEMASDVAKQLLRLEEKDMRCVVWFGFFWCVFVCIYIHMYMCVCVCRHAKAAAVLCCDATFVAWMQRGPQICALSSH